MTVRTSMSALIARVRLLIAEPATTLFSDQQVQDTLDECRENIRYQLLTPQPTFANPGGIQYNDYYSGDDPEHPRGFWEADETLIWGDFTTLTPTSSDEIVGHWTFNNQLPPVLITGKRYDVYRASADLLDYKIAALSATQIDFTADGQSFRLSQQLAFLCKMRDDYRRKQRARLGASGRADSPSERPLGVAPGQASLAGDVSGSVPFLTGE
jgi:hypothetical protein